MSPSINRHPDYIRADELIVRRDYAAGRAVVEEALSSLRESAPKEDRLSLQLLRAECQAFTGHHDEALRVAEPASEQLSQGQDHDLYARACFVSAVSLYHLGEIDRAYEIGQMGLYASKRIGDRLGVVKALNWLGNIVFYKSDFSRAIEFYSDCATAATDSGYPQFAAVASGNIARAMILTGKLREAQEHLRSSREGLETHLHRVSVLRNQLSVSFLHVQLREFEQAEGLLQELEQEVFSSPRVREQGAWCEYSAELKLATGDYDGALAHLNRAIELASGSARDESVIGQSRRLLAETYLAQTRWHDAIAAGEDALQSIRKVGERFEEGVVYRILAEAQAQLGLHAEARASFKRSTDILRDIDARLEWAKTCLAAGRCSCFTRRERIAHLVEAERLFSDIAVEYWIEEVRAELQTVLHDRETELQRQSVSTPGRISAQFVTSDRATRETVRLAERLARSDIAILLTGETGVGKDQLAWHIHESSPRRTQRFLPIDLSVLPDSLWESEVFGHRKGAFTGATADKIGLLESANGGTVFLNEIGNLPPSFQAKLLELLDTHHIRRVGETESRPLDVRFIAATNVVLRDAVAEGKFRSDLYYRLAQAPLHLEPLRNRRDDIIPLLQHFLIAYGVPRTELPILDNQLWVERARNGHWAGNVRQLKSFVHRLVAITDRPSDPDFADWAQRLLEQIDIIHEPNVGARTSSESLLSALERNNWNQRATARDLGITEGGVRHLMRRLGVRRPNDS